MENAFHQIGLPHAPTSINSYQLWLATIYIAANNRLFMFTSNDVVVCHNRCQFADKDTNSFPKTSDSASFSTSFNIDKEEESMISAPYLYRVLYLKAVANSRAQYQHQLKIEVSRPPSYFCHYFFAIAIFLRKGCQVVKTPINTRVATSKRLSKVDKRLSYFGRMFFGMDSG